MYRGKRAEVAEKSMAMRARDRVHSGLLAWVGSRTDFLAEDVSQQEFHRNHVADAAAEKR